MRRKLSKCLKKLDKNLIIKTGANIMQIKIKRIKNGKLPEYKTQGSAGADCYARITGRLVLEPGETYTFPLGFAVEIPEGYEMQIRPRSGLASKNKINVILGTIDSDYRGEVGAIFWNCGDEAFEVRGGDRIAQAVICPVIKAEWCLTENLSETERGEGGFGSTGISYEKFYEPFTKIEEVKKCFGHKVIIDNYLDGLVVDCKKDPVFSWFYVVIRLKENQKMNGLNVVEMPLSTAFERIKIDGHRFGKEIEFE